MKTNFPSNTTRTILPLGSLHHTQKKNLSCWDLLVPMLTLLKTILNFKASKVRRRSLVIIHDVFHLRSVGSRAVMYEAGTQIDIITHATLPFYRQRNRVERNSTTPIWTGQQTVRITTILTIYPLESLHHSQTKTWVFRVTVFSLFKSIFILRRPRSDGVVITSTNLSHNPWCIPFS